MDFPQYAVQAQKWANFLDTDFPLMNSFEEPFVYHNPEELTYQDIFDKLTSIAISYAQFADRHAKYNRAVALRVLIYAMEHGYQTPDEKPSREVMKKVIVTRDRYTGIRNYFESYGVTRAINEYLDRIRVLKTVPRIEALNTKKVKFTISDKTFEFTPNKFKKIILEAEKQEAAKEKLRRGLQLV